MQNFEIAKENSVAASHTAFLLKLDNRDKVGDYSLARRAESCPLSPVIRMNVLLIGPRGSGKTTIGALLATRLALTFIDLDSMTLESFPGQSVGDIWKTLGEQAWREAELETLHRALAFRDAVVALGGGTPIIPEAFKRISEMRSLKQATVVYLRCPHTLLRARLQKTPGDRPSLTGRDFIDEIPLVLSQREPTYIALADLVYDIGDESAEDAAQGIAACLSQLPD